MASTLCDRRPDNTDFSDNGQLSFYDVLKFFNNPINEEQAWAICYQCAQFYRRLLPPEKLHDFYQFGMESVYFSRDGDVYIRSRGSVTGENETTKEHKIYGSRKHIASEYDALQTLGWIIFEALDYGIGEMEERPLSLGLETLIHGMIREATDTESLSIEDEGIVKDAGEEDHLMSFRDVVKVCTERLARQEEAQHHYRAVCRALVAEAVELHTFLEKIALSREKLHQEVADQDSRLLELQRGDWARLWMQVMRSLRHGVRLKKIEQEEVVVATHTPVEYELTPFEILLDDIRYRRYTLHKIMVNGDIPPTVKKDAHAVILDFIRSRPPLRRANDRKLKALPPKPPDAREQLLEDIRARPKLNPVVRDVSHAAAHTTAAAASVTTSGSHQVSRGEDEDPKSKSPLPPVRKLIKPDFSLLLSNSFEESDVDSEAGSPEKVGPHSIQARLSPLTSPVRDNMNASWHTGGMVGHEGRSIRLQRRHTIMVCESPTDSKLTALQELPPVEEEEEPSPTEDQTPRFHYGSDSPLSGLPDHTLHNGHNLLRGGTRHQGAIYRSEHRRSLTTGLTAIPEDEDSADCVGGHEGGLFRRQDRRHSMPAVPHRPDLARFSPKSRGSRSPGSRNVGGGITNAGFYAGDCHSHLALDSETGGNWCRMTGIRPPPSPLTAHKKGEGGDLALLTATETMHKRGKSRSKRWQNPIECLSLTLEEVTHIRSVLTKAELESLVSHPDLYNQVSKNKVCFTCKTTRFSLFGEWGSRCKFCKRTVCSKCMRKMYIPTEQLKDVPVYTLSSTPLSQETLALVHNYVHSYFSALDRTNAARLSSSSPTSSPRPGCGSSGAPDQQKGKHFLQRSHSLNLPCNTGAGGSRKGPLTSICCDCKSMVMEILRASKSSLAALLPAVQSVGASSLLSTSSSSHTSTSGSHTSTSSSTPTSSSSTSSSC